jgi:hypothetical protein
VVPAGALVRHLPDSSFVPVSASNRIISDLLPLITSNFFLDRVDGVAMTSGGEGGARIAGAGDAMGGFVSCRGAVRVTGLTTADGAAVEALEPGLPRKSCSRRTALGFSSLFDRVGFSVRGADGHRPEPGQEPCSVRV